MPDFRSVFYDRYVSTFKGRGAQSNPSDHGWYEAWCRHKYGPLLKGLGAGSRILELGCGPGHMLAFLKRSGFDAAEGIDISQEQVALAAEAGFRAKVADAFDYLEGKEDTFDAVISLNFIEHFHREELLRLVPMVFGSLKNGGRWILQTCNGEGLFPGGVIYGDLTHVTIFTPSSLQQLLRLSGFQDFSFSETGPTPVSLRARLRLLAWRGVKIAANLVRQIETRSPQAIWTENMICCCRKPHAERESSRRQI